MTQKLWAHYNIYGTCGTVLQGASFVGFLGSVRFNFIMPYADLILLCLHPHRAESLSVAFV